MPIQLTKTHAKVAGIIMSTVLLAGLISYGTSRQLTKNLVQQCGSENRVRRSNEELLVALKSAHNNISRQDAQEKFVATNLIDGDFETYAYPNDRRVDYTVELIDLYPIEKVTLVWNEFGEQENYIARWFLEGCNERGRWTIMARGGAPKSKVTAVKTKDTVSQVRLRAEAKRDWIGVYEMKIE